MFHCDVGEAGDGRTIIRFECDVCGFETDWLIARSPHVENKGRVCPKCGGDVSKAGKG